MRWEDGAFIYAFWGINIALLCWVLLTIGAQRYVQQCRQELRALLESVPTNLPSVSVLVPAHNEEEVIEETVRALGALEYPKDKLQIIVIDDASRDSTADILDALALEIPQLTVLHIPKGKGGKGKSRTLNLGLPHATGEVIAVYDADNTPEPLALRLLVQTLMAQPKLAAVNGKVRTRNWQASWLTRFINLEFMYFQWVFQGGRWYWLKLGTLMGTNYVIWRHYLTALGGFDEASLVDDTEMSFRLLQGGRQIRWVPYAVTWEQEPDTYKVWFKQRVRWSKGNFYVTFKYLPQAFQRPYPIGVELLNFILNFLVFFPALLVSTLILLLGLLGLVSVTIPGPFHILWGLSLIVYLAQMSFAITLEQPKLSNYVYGALSYFSYALLFIPVSLMALWQYILDSLTKREVTWVKTARKKEK